MAPDYDELRTAVKESPENLLEFLMSAKSPDAKSVVQELDEADTVDGLTLGRVLPSIGIQEGKAGMTAGVACQDR